MKIGKKKQQWNTSYRFLALLLKTYFLKLLRDNSSFSDKKMLDYNTNLFCETDRKCVKT